MFGSVVLSCQVSGIRSRRTFKLCVLVKSICKKIRTALSAFLRPVGRANRIGAVEHVAALKGFRLLLSLLLHSETSGRCLQVYRLFASRTLSPCWVGWSFDRIRVRLR